MLLAAGAFWVEAVEDFAAGVCWARARASQRESGSEKHSGRGQSCFQVRSFHTRNQNTKRQRRQSQSEAADTTAEHIGLMHRER